jgi:hypothetical protein
MAGGMLTKQADQLTAKKLNDVNDAVAGGQIVSLPSGVTGPIVSATQTGDRIVLDDLTALALSDTTVGTLYGGIYYYCGTYLSSTASPALGTAAFFRAADLPPAITTPPFNQVTADANPSAAVPTQYAGVFINAITKGNYGWIQVGGIISCLFDSTLAGTVAVGQPVNVKTSPVVASTFDVGNAVAATNASMIVIADIVGAAIVLPAVSTVSAVLQTRSPFPKI